MNKSINYKEMIFEYGIVLVLIILFIFFSVLIPNFASFGNILSIAEQVSMFGVISIGVTFVIITGGIDLSSGSIVALTSVICAMIVGGDGGIWLVLGGALAAIAVGGLCGAINGSFTAYGNIPPFIATLGMMTIARGFAQLVSQGRPVDASADAFTAMADFKFLNIPGLVYIYIIVAVCATILLSRTQYGRHVYAIGGNRNASRICGINVKRTLLITYIFAGTLAGLAAVMLASRTYSGNPVAGEMWELDAIAATVIGGTSLSGGKGKVWMCVIGALIIGVINKALNLMGVSPYWQQIIKGFIIISAVLLDTLQNRKST